MCLLSMSLQIGKPARSVRYRQLYARRSDRAAVVMLSLVFAHQQCHFFFSLKFVEEMRPNGELSGSTRCTDRSDFYRTALASGTSMVGCLCTRRLILSPHVVGNGLDAPKPGRPPQSLPNWHGSISKLIHKSLTVNDSRYSAYS